MKKQQPHGYKPLGRRYPETSVGWYRRTVDIPKGRFGAAHLIKRFPNSPSIILWSMGNDEWIMMIHSQGVRVIDDMIARSH